jgi:hypothetical protein
MLKLAWLEDGPCLRHDTLTIATLDTIATFVNMVAMFTEVTRW